MKTSTEQIEQIKELIQKHKKEYRKRIIAERELKLLRQQVQELEQLCSELSESGYNASKVLALIPQLLHSIEIRDWYSIPLLLSETKEER